MQRRPAAANGARMVQTRARIGVLLVALLVVAGGAYAARGLLPGAVDALMNGVSNDAPAATDEDRAWVARHPVVDLHADPLLWNRDLLVRGTRGHVDVPRLLEGHVVLQVMGAPTHVPLFLNMRFNPRFPEVTQALADVYGWGEAARGSSMGRALAMAAHLTRATERSGGVFRLIRTAEDLDAHLLAVNRGEKRTAALLATEGAYPLEGGVAALPTLVAAGYRMVGLAHFVDGAVCGSAHGVEGHGLTELGRALVPALEDAGVTVDLAHASPATVEDTLALVRKPVVFSHTGVQATCAGPRNLSDEQLRRVATNGGLVGIGFFAAAVCGTDTASVVRALMHVVRTVGVRHAALGSDWDGAVTTPWDAAGTAELVHGLRKAGLTDADLQGVMGGNALRVLRQNLPDGGAN